MNVKPSLTLDLLERQTAMQLRQRQLQIQTRETRTKRRDTLQRHWRRVQLYLDRCEALLTTVIVIDGATGTQDVFGHEEVHPLEPYARRELRKLWTQNYLDAFPYGYDGED